MSRKTTFTSAALCASWAKHATSEPKGTRADVVTDMLAEAGLEDNKDNRSKCYNNVTQRVAQLKTNKTQPITFPALAEGKRGARRTTDDLSALQALLNGPTQAEEEGEGEGEDADAADAVEAATDAVENPDDVEVVVETPAGEVLEDE